MAYFRADYQTLRNGVVIASEPVYFEYNGSQLNCTQAEASVSLGLTDAQIQALRAFCTQVAPVVPVGYRVAVRECSGFDVIVIEDNQDAPGGEAVDGFDGSYTFTKVGSDFSGRPFVSTPAPILTAVTQEKPRLRGNHFAFEPQSALNVALFKRIPKFTPHPSKVLIYPGGLYMDEADNDLIGRGWTHLSESTKFNSQIYPTKYKRAMEEANYALAYNAAQSLPPGDPRRQCLLDWAGPLPAFEGTHIFIDREDSAQLYALNWWAHLKQASVSGAGVEYFSVNHEVNQARNPDQYYEEWARQIGWLNKHIIAAAEAEGVNLKAANTDFGNLSHVGPHFFDDNDPDTGYPRYMSYWTISAPYRGSSQSNPIGNGSDMSNLLLAGKAFTGVGRYMQHTTDGQSMFEKNGDGTLKLVDGKPVWRSDKRTATITGQQTVVYKDDNWWAMMKRYGYEASSYANTFFRAGSKHLPLSTDRRAGYENIRFSTQFRLDTEIDTGNTDLGPGYNGLTEAEWGTLNERPLYPNWVEGNAIRMYLCDDYLRGWMESQPQTALGADNGRDSKARASVEIYAKGFQRAAALNWIFDTPYQHIEPKLWMKNQGLVSSLNPDEAFYRKPILRGGHGMYQSRRTIWMRGEWPCQDEDKTTDVTCWVNTGSVQSPSYTIRLAGRTTFLDYWQLPAGFPEFESKHVYFQFNSLLGEKITWRGDYREAKITSPPTPPNPA